MSDLQQQFLRKAARQKRKILFLRILFFVIFIAIWEIAGE